MRVIAAVLALTGSTHALLLSPRLRMSAHYRIVMSSVDDGLLKDAAASAFDEGECITSAESAAELGECLGGAPAEPYVFAGAPPRAAVSMKDVPAVTRDPDECIVSAESIGEIEDCHAEQTAAVTAAVVEDLEEGGCTLVGETATEVWFACEEGSDSSAVKCADEDFGVGGGPGILPQDGEKLCVAEKPK